jgi:rhodanese-related sulfurtransferase
MKEMFKIKKRYLLMSLILIFLAGGTLLLPEKYDTTELSPEQLLTDINDDTRYLSTDDVAHIIISQNPYYLLIDVRDTISYKNFKLPGAINIPLENILDKNEDGNYKWEAYLNQDLRKNIFYSNGTIYAHQAWMLTRRLNYKNNYVMEGGLNKWIETIIQVPRPELDATDIEMNLYAFRKAASMFFGGGGTVVNETNTDTPVFSVRKKEKEVGGGC